MGTSEKAHKADKPVYLEVRKMIDPDTGEVFGCLVPDSWASQQIMREREYRVGAVLRATLTAPRNSRFFRLVHQLGTLVRENVAGFDGLTSHEVIKRLQRESGICCDIELIDASPVVTAILGAISRMLGEKIASSLAPLLPELRTIAVMTPQSLAFDAMEEHDFQTLWAGICGHLVDRYWPTLTAEQVMAMAEMMPRNQGA